MNEQICLNIDKPRKQRALELLRAKYGGSESLERVLWLIIMQEAEQGVLDARSQPAAQYLNELLTVGAELKRLAG